MAVGAVTEGALSGNVRQLAQVYLTRTRLLKYPHPPMLHAPSRETLRATLTTPIDMSVVRELALRFPLPPRITGKYRGSYSVKIRE